MVDFYILPSSHDIDIVNKQMRLTTTVEENTRQKVAITLLAFKGEWFVNTNFGVPYLKNASNPVQLLDKNNKGVVDVELKKAILGVDTIEVLSTYESTLDLASREMTVAFSAITTTGDLIEFNESLGI